ncbi:MAG: DUF2125 domain-containing protein [Hyphomicrobiales bacterium]|jgi:hypothetical protein|nr:DUF2125 domain-containing protein [Hyphomicrobiales bacterium]
MMSPSVVPAAAPRRRWPLFLPFALMVLLAAAWTAVWFYAAARAEAEIAVWRERERQAGRAQDCASQSIGGYPFRIEVRCGGASFELKGTPTLQLKLPLAVVAVQVYDPKLLIGEFTGPLEISEPGGPAAGIVNWTSAQASVRGAPAGVERASLALVEPTVRDPSIVANDAVFRARRLELHGRPAAGSTADNPLVETALRLEAAVADKLHPLAAKPIDADIAAILRGVNDISPKPWPARFREWQARDGQIEITKARLAQEDVIAVGTGVLKLTSRGGLDGDLKVTVVGIEKILKMFGIERIMSEGQIGATFNALDRLMPGLGGIARQSAAPGLVAALGQRTELEGKPAVAFPVRFVDGAVFLGPFQVGMVSPLF